MYSSVFHLDACSFVASTASILVVLGLHRSNPSTPTQPRRPDFIGVTANHQATPYYDFQSQIGQVPRQMMVQGYGSPQRRFMSEGKYNQHISSLYK